MLWPGLFVMTMGENRKAKRRSYAARGLGACVNRALPGPAATACYSTGSRNGLR
jgi:hypothetical protein